jgi:hypothetical protein
MAGPLLGGSSLERLSRSFGLEKPQDQMIKWYLDVHQYYTPESFAFHFVLKDSEENLATHLAIAIVHGSTGSNFNSITFEYFAEAAREMVHAPNNIKLDQLRRDISNLAKLFSGRLSRKYVRDLLFETVEEVNIIELHPTYGEGMPFPYTWEFRWLKIEKQLESVGLTWEEAESLFRRIVTKNTPEEVQKLMQ